MTITKKSVSVKVDKYEFNGKLYDTMQDAQDAEEAMNPHVAFINDLIRKERGWASGKSYTEIANMEGVWQIQDEGPVDFRSSYVRSTLGFVRGKFEDVVKYAMTIPGFKGYGWGTIEPVQIVDVPTQS